MKTIFRLFSFAFIAFDLSAIFVVTQDNKMTDVTITGRVYEPAKLEPSVERVKSLKLPAGFQIVKFAEIANPRMLAVAADGTVYVSQRTPGTVSMLRDTNGDGAADVQKVVVEKPQMPVCIVPAAKCIW